MFHVQYLVDRTAGGWTATLVHLPTYRVLARHDFADSDDADRWGRMACGYWLFEHDTLAAMRTALICMWVAALIADVALARIFRASLIAGCCTVAPVAALTGLFVWCALQQRARDRAFCSGAWATPKAAPVGLDSAPGTE